MTPLAAMRRAAHRCALDITKPVWLQILLILRAPFCVVFSQRLAPAAVQEAPAPILLRSCVGRSQFLPNFVLSGCLQGKHIASEGGREYILHDAEKEAAEKVAAAMLTEEDRRSGQSSAPESTFATLTAQAIVDWNVQKVSA